ncbi:MAG: geranylgeranylglyceryl/heptaprenylglyceryl phosphate synthase [Rhodothermales bacterium]|nr:geranylgeranylglyceryl/heptaprenylglyceryl phosphate synthase [Rhodothermales bacterium]
MSTVFQRLLNIRDSRGAGFVLLVDPDDTTEDALPDLAARAGSVGVDAIFVGGSLIHSLELERYVATLKRHTDLPVIGFPGAITQVVPSLDALLYLMVISGRNPDYLIGRHVVAAPLIRKMGLETLSTGYMLVESGPLTTAQYMVGSMPLPRNKPGVAAATAMAGEMLGLQCMYLDGGSGAESPVPDRMIRAVADAVDVPIIVGGGIRTPETVAAKVRAGASFVVVGNAFEDDGDVGFMRAMAEAAHGGLSVS